MLRIARAVRTMASRNADEIGRVIRQEVAKWTAGIHGQETSMAGELNGRTIAVLATDGLSRLKSSNLLGR